MQAIEPKENKREEQEKKGRKEKKMR